MCGRFTHLFTWRELHRLMTMLTWPVDELAPRYNVAPTQQAPIVRTVRADSGAIGREGVSMRWGLIPSWADDPSIGSRLINARGETVDVKPAFRNAFRKQRCLVPISGFYEWQKPEGKGPKRPHYIAPAGGGILVLAGLWERWHRDEGEPIESFTIITTEPNDSLRPLHDRMPVILEPHDWESWLAPEQGGAAELKKLLRPCDPRLLRVQAVSTHVNSPAHDDSRCIEPVASLF